MSVREYPQFSGIAEYYDALMCGVPYRRWMRYLQRIFTLRGLKPLTVLDLACGTGNVSELFCMNGLDVVGVDISEEMIRKAQSKAAEQELNISYHTMNAAELDLSEKPFDLCVSLFDSLNYITDPSELRKAIRCVFDHVRPGGLFIFDINSAFALQFNFFDQENMMSDDKLRYCWKSLYEPSTRLCSVNMRFYVRQKNGEDREFVETHLQFAYREAELREMLTQAGFTDIETYHAYTFAPVSETTDRIFFVANRP